MSMNMNLILFRVPMWLQAFVCAICNHVLPGCAKRETLDVGNCWKARQGRKDSPEGWNITAGNDVLDGRHCGAQTPEGDGTGRERVRVSENGMA